ncbi:hypothetical protein N0V90_007792 [Kalmusia sp. IMI 367209]|nr:hypothetical protein N0V90_007792 [Kalmusia sp. IMI 367209]
MDPGPGPPQQSPDDYSARERRERTGVAVGIVVGVFVLIAGPLCLLYFANWRRRRRDRRTESRDLEGTTAVSRGEKDGTTLHERTEDTTLVTRVDERDYQINLGVQRKEHEQDPSSPLNSCSIPKATNQVTTEEVLGLDKVSFLRNLPIGSNPSSVSNSAAQPLNITVLPSRLPHIGLSDLEGESSKQAEEIPDDNECVSPWAVEHEPNPVIFKHLLGPKGKGVVNEDDTIQNENGDGLLQGEPYPEYGMDLDDPPRNNEVQQNAQEAMIASEGDGSKESSPSEETSSSSPSSTDSQDSAAPLMDHKSQENNSQSPTLNQDILEQLQTASGSGHEVTQGVGRTLCIHCKRSFKTTGQLNPALTSIASTSVATPALYAPTHSTSRPTSNATNAQSTETIFLPRPAASDVPTRGARSPRKSFYDEITSKDMLRGARGEQKQRSHKE